MGWRTLMTDWKFLDYTFIGENKTSRWLDRSIQDIDWSGEYRQASVLHSFIIQSSEKMLKPRSNRQVRQNFFSQRVIDEWNKLPSVILLRQLQSTCLRTSSVQFSLIYICIAHPLMYLMRYRSTSVNIYKITRKPSCRWQTRATRCNVIIAP